VLGGEPLLGQRTGIGHYTWRLYLGLRAHTAVDEVLAFAHLRWIDPQADAGAAAQSPSPQRPAAWRRLLRMLPGCPRLRAAVQAARFRRSLARLGGPLLYHEPNYVLRPFDGPSLATIHDLGWLHHPDWLDPATRRWLEAGMPRSLERATRIIAVSEFVRRELIEILGIAPARISVTPLGVDARFHPRGTRELTPALARYGLTPGGYLLSVATLEPRKNLQRLLRAFAALPLRLQRARPLVLVGPAGWGAAAERAQAERLERRGLLRRLGYVGDQALRDLFAGAAGVAAPSRYEGFGLPVLEGMASGVPVLTSAGSAMVEVAGEAALLVDPLDDGAIRDGLERLLSDSELQARLSAAGPRRAQAFRWERTLDATLEAYRAALAG
jgi:alpha-1,3-rhamnosyl/mannosyltransferase